MTELVKKLEQDHRRIAHVLLRLVGELGSCRNAAFHNPRFVEHFSNELSYIHDFPNQLNHPLENRVYRKLLEKDIPDRGLIESAMAEHRKLELKAEYLIAKIKQIIANKTAPTPLLIQQANELMTDQLEHQSRESRHIFPLIEKYLDPSDIRDIEQRSETVPMNITLRQHFSSLYTNIMNHQVAV